MEDLFSTVETKKQQKDEKTTTLDLSLSNDSDQENQQVSKISV